MIYRESNTAFSSVYGCDLHGYKGIGYMLR